MVKIIIAFLLKLLLFLCIILSVQHSSAQTISKYSPGYPELNHLIKSSNGGYYAVSSHFSEILLVRLDDQLNILWTKKYSGFFVSEKVFFFKQVNSDHLFIGGGFINTTGQYFDGGFFYETDSV